MIIFTKLLLAHLIGDFLLQPASWVVHKESKKVRSKFLYIHVLLHFIMMLFVLWDSSKWLLVLCITLSHYLIDLAKLYIAPVFKNASVPFFIDQALHILVLYVAAFHDGFWERSSLFLEQLDLALLTAVIFVTFPAGVIMGKLLAPMAEQIELDHESLPNAGKYIGVMERLFVFIFILLGKWEAIGLLITAKSVFRFNDLKESNNRKLTEYILIGTLLSFGIAVVTGLVYTYQ